MRILSNSAGYRLRLTELQSTDPLSVSHGGG